MYANQISPPITQRDLTEILDAIEFINNKLKRLVQLSQEEKTALPKLNENTVDFVFQCLYEAENNPDLVPDGINLKEIRKDAELINSIQKIIVPLNKLMRKLEDSALLAGSEAYIPSIAIHNTLVGLKDKARARESFALEN